MKVVRRLFGALAMLAMLMPLTTAMAQAPAAAVQGYVLGPGDVIEVSVIGRDDFRRRAQIGPDGTIKLPLIGSVKASERSPQEFEQDVAVLLQQGGFFAKADVSVEIVTYASRYVIVLGAVGSPGLVPVDRAYRVSEILARVGGVRDGAADYVVLSPSTAKEQRLPIVQIATGSAERDPVVAPGDKIYVPAAETFFVYGQVNAPGVYPLLADMTLRKALARGGGLSPSGSERGVKVYRDGVEMKRVDLGAAIQPGDVIVVGERFF